MDSNKRKEIDLWCNDDNKIVRNIGESIVLKAKNAELSFPIIYPIEEFKALNNELTVIGLSPFNDYHIYEIIHKNPGIEHVSYYLKDMSLGDDIKKMLTHPTDLYDVSKFWLEMRT